MTGVDVTVDPQFEVTPYEVCPTIFSKGPSRKVTNRPYVEGSESTCLLANLSDNVNLLKLSIQNEGIPCYGQELLSKETQLKDWSASTCVVSHYC